MRLPQQGKDLSGSLLPFDLCLTEAVSFTVELVCIVLIIINASCS